MTVHFAAEKNVTEQSQSPQSPRCCAKNVLKYMLQRKGDLTVVMPTIEVLSLLISVRLVSDNLRQKKLECCWPSLT